MRESAATKTKEGLTLRR